MTITDGLGWQMFVEKRWHIATPFTNLHTQKEGGRLHVDDNFVDDDDHFCFVIELVDVLK